jgi:hypothetical protein
MNVAVTAGDGLANSLKICVGPSEHKLGVADKRTMHLAVQAPYSQELGHVDSIVPCDWRNKEFAAVNIHNHNLRPLKWVSQLLAGQK